MDQHKLERRKLLALTAGIGTAAIAGCTDALNGDDNGDDTDDDTEPTDDNGDDDTDPDSDENGNGEDNGDDDEDPDDEEGDDDEVEEEVREMLTEFYNAWLHQDGETMIDLLHTPRTWPEDEAFENLPEVNFDVDVVDVELDLVDDNVSADEMVLIAEENPELSEDEAPEVAETPTRVYAVEAVFSDTPDPITDDEQRIVENLRREADRIVSIQDGGWRVV